VITAAVLGVIAHFLVFRPVRHAPVLAQVVVGVALMIVLQALTVIRFGPNNIAVQAALGDHYFTVLGARLSSAELVMAAVMIVLSLLIWVYLRFTNAGVATRACANNERAAILMGYSPSRLALIAWVIGNVVATLGAIMGSQLTGLNPTNLTLLVVPALAVVLVARLQSIGTVVVAGLGLGAVQSLLTLVATKAWWPKWAASGIDQVVPFLIVMIILFLLGKRLPARGTLQSIRLPDVVIPRIRLVPAGVVVAVTLVLLIVLQGDFRFGLTVSIIYMLLALSYVVVTGYLGQISLAQLAFAGAAGFALSKLSTNWGVPFPIGLILSAVLATALGLLVSLPALRIRGAQLAIVTIAMGLAIERFVFNNYSLTPPNGNPVADPRLFGLNLSVRQGYDIARLPFAVMVLVVAILIGLVFVRLVSGDLGRAFLAVRANERAAASSGIDVRLTKFIGFGVSAFIAGVSGCLIAYSQGQLSASSFSTFVGLEVLAWAYLGGITSIGGSVIGGLIASGGIVFTIISHYWNTGSVYALFSGLLLILTAVLNPSGIAGELRRQVAWVRSALLRSRLQPVIASTGSATASDVKDHAHVG
jgi:branched-chain amino acid transport system permease protein